MSRAERGATAAHDATPRRQSERAKTTPQTTNALLTIEGVNDIAATAVEAAMEELVSLVREYCGGEVPWSLLDRDHPSAVMA